MNTILDFYRDCFPFENWQKNNLMIEWVFLSQTKCNFFYNHEYNIAEDNWLSILIVIFNMNYNFFSLKTDLSNTIKCVIKCILYQSFVFKILLSYEMKKKIIHLMKYYEEGNDQEKGIFNNNVKYVLNDCKTLSYKQLRIIIKYWSYSMIMIFESFKWN